jgi:hypothetical protein
MPFENSVLQSEDKLVGGTYMNLMTNQSTAVSLMSNLGGAESDLLEKAASVAASCTDAFTQQLTAAAQNVSNQTTTTGCDIAETAYNTLNTEGSNMTSAANTATSVGSQMVQATQSAIVNAINNMRPAIDNANAVAQVIAAIR